MLGRNDCYVTTIILLNKGLVYAGATSLALVFSGGGGAHALAVASYFSMYRV
jgi:hypothetical protein